MQSVRQDLLKGFQNEIAQIFEMNQNYKGDDKLKIFKSPEYIVLSGVIKLTHPHAPDTEILTYIISFHSQSLRNT